MRALLSAFEGPGVLAPKGWYCFGTYGSSGDTLFISPTPVGPSQFFGNESEAIAGPSIQFSRTLGDTSGAFEVAQIMSVAFPEWRSWAERVRHGFDLPENSYHWGPYPTDKLIQRSKTVVEFATPAHSQGLGTRNWLKPSDRPIRGVAILVGDTPDLWHLSVRLPANLDYLAPAIIEQVERDAAKLSGPSPK